MFQMGRAEGVTSRPKKREQNINGAPKCDRMGFFYDREPGMFFYYRLANVYGFFIIIIIF